MAKKSDPTKPAAKRPEALHWAGCTLNNYTTYDEQKFISLIRPIANYYVYGKEIGEKCGTPHLQFMISFKVKTRLTALKKIFPTAHFEIKAALSTFKHASDYCKKGMQSHEEWDECAQAGPHFGVHAVYVEWGTLPSDVPTKQTKDDTYAHALAADNTKDAMNIIKQLAPRDFCLYGHTIERNIQKSMRKPTLVRFTMDAFTIPPQDLTKTILLTGPSNMGKTNYAKAHFNNPLIVTVLDQLAEFNDSYDGIVFDDMSFVNYLPETVIHIVDQDEDRAIRLRYVYAKIPHSTKKIICHNNDNPLFNPDTISPEQRIAIERRVTHYRINEDIRKSSDKM